MKVYIEVEVKLHLGTEWEWSDALQYNENLIYASHRSFLPHFLKD